MIKNPASRWPELIRGIQLARNTTPKETIMKLFSAILPDCKQIYIFQDNPYHLVDYQMSIQIRWRNISGKVMMQETHESNQLHGSLLLYFKQVIL